VAFTFQVKLAVTLLFAAATLLLAGCASAPHKGLKVSVPLDPGQFLGHHLSLVSDNEVEDLYFGKNMTAWAVFGTNGATNAFPSTASMMVSAYGRGSNTVKLTNLVWNITGGNQLVITDRRTENTHTWAIFYQFSSFADDSAVTLDGSKYKRE
jgi:hypothetical protein